MKMNFSIEKALLGFIAIGMATIAIELLPVSRKAAYWNRCLNTTSSTLNKVPAVQKIKTKGRDALAVMICNGAVFEPKIKRPIK